MKTKKLYFNVYQQNYLSMNFGLVKARVRPPIKLRFINSALGWKGNAWKMTVVGTRKISNSDAPSFWLLPNRRSTEPTIRQAIAPNNKKCANDSGIPCPEIASTTDENLVIFDGTATTKTADKQSLPMKSTNFHTCGWGIGLIGSLLISTNDVVLAQLVWIPYKKAFMKAILMDWELSAMNMSEFKTRRVYWFRSLNAFGHQRQLKAWMKHTLDPISAITMVW